MDYMGQISRPGGRLPAGPKAFSRARRQRAGFGSLLRQSWPVPVASSAKMGCSKPRSATDRSSQECGHYHFRVRHLLLDVRHLIFPMLLKRG